MQIRYVCWLIYISIVGLYFIYLKKHFNCDFVWMISLIIRSPNPPWCPFLMYETGSFGIHTERVPNYIFLSMNEQNYNQLIIGISMSDIDQTIRFFLALTDHHVIHIKLAVCQKVEGRKKVNDSSSSSRVRFCPVNSWALISSIFTSV